MDIFSFQNLLAAYYQCRKTKRYTANAAKFEANFEKELLKLEYELENHTYRHGRYVCFAISDPKIREVWAADFRDRIIHHLLIKYLEPVWEPKFIFHSYACRPKKGAHKAINCLKKTIANPLISAQLYYLQIDIESFFMSIDKKILFSLIKKQIKNPNILWLAELIIFQNPTDNYIIKGDQKILNSIPGHKSLFYIPKSKGLPIGNYTSQFFANVYLNKVDQFIKHNLKCRYYFRYMDDLLLLHNSKKQLLFLRNKISNFLQNNLLLQLHPKKQILQPITHGIDFLGYITRPDYILSRRRVVINLKKKLHYFNKIIDPKTKFGQENENNLTIPLLFADKMPAFNFILKTQAVINSYYGHFKHANCFNLRKKLYFNYFKELKTFFKPADKNFSHFVIYKNIKKFHQDKNKHF